MVRLLAKDKRRNEAQFVTQKYIYEKSSIKYIKGGGAMSIKKIPFPYYKVKKGENLRIISEKFQIESTKILLDNNLSPKQIKEGVFIKIQK